MRTMYHATRDISLPDIQQQGLTPAMLPEEFRGRKGIYLSTDPEYVIEFASVMTKMGRDVIQEQGLTRRLHDWYLLEVNIPSDTHLEPDPGYVVEGEYRGYILFGSVGPENIRVLRKLSAEELLAR